MTTTDLPLVAETGQPLVVADDVWKTNIQPVNVSRNIGREQVYELGKRGPYRRYVNLPPEQTPPDALALAAEPAAGKQMLAMPGMVVELEGEGVVGDAFRVGETRVGRVMRVVGDGRVWVWFRLERPMDVAAKEMSAEERLRSAREQVAASVATEWDEAHPEKMYVMVPTYELR